MKNKYRALLVIAVFALTSSTFAQSYIDTTFGEKGYANTFIIYVDRNLTHNEIADLKVLSDDKIISLGFSRNMSSSIGSLAKYNSNGTLDTTFANKGTLTLYVDDNDMIGSFTMKKIEILPNKKLLLLGHFNALWEKPFYARELGLNGERDTSYHKFGAPWRLQGDKWEKKTIILNPSGGFFIAGHYVKPSTGERFFSLIKYNGYSYFPDSSFGITGALHIIPPAGFGGAEDGLITPNNKILLGGYSQDINGIKGFQLIQLHLNGSIDTSFGYKGFSRLQISSTESSLTNLEVTPDGKIYAIGFSNINNKNTLSVFRLNSDGSIDYSFSNDGVETYDFAGNILPVRSLQRDNKILILCQKDGMSSCLIRINYNGTIDNTFGTEGRVILEKPIKAQGLGIQSDGKIIVGGMNQLPIYFDTLKHGYCYSLVRVKANNLNDGNTVDVKDEHNVITSFKLDQNYPNPFNPSTTINFSLPEVSDVTLKVYDVLGKEVASLINERKEAGDHRVNFNAENLSAGMYIYKLTAGSNTISKKMMLVK